VSALWDGRPQAVAPTNVCEIEPLPKSQVDATRLIWKTMMVAAMSFRKLNSPQSAEKVARGTKYDTGKEIRLAA